MSESAELIEALQGLVALVRREVAEVHRIHNAPRREPAETLRLKLAEASTERFLGHIDATLERLRGQLAGPGAPRGLPETADRG